MAIARTFKVFLSDTILLKNTYHCLIACHLPLMELNSFDGADILYILEEFQSDQPINLLPPFPLPIHNTRQILPADFRDILL